MTDCLPIRPIGPFRRSLAPPGSKSLTNRALLLAALADGRSTLHRPLIADDTRRMIEALDTLGFQPRLAADESRIEVSGQGGRIPEPKAMLNLGNAGTAMRPLTAMCCLDGLTYVLDGVERMRQRPIGQLVDPLRHLGANIEYLAEEGYPPLRVHGGGLDGGDVEMGATLSSQFITALLMAGPCMRYGLAIRFTGPVTSKPYVAMTLGLMRVFGVEPVVNESFTRIDIGPGTYRPVDYRIEPDASNAGYFLAAAAIVPGSQCTIEGLGKGSLQGDVGFADVLAQMGAGLTFGRDFITIIGPAGDQTLRGIDVDLNHMPDMAQTLAVVALFAEGPTSIRNVGNLRVKETDRMAALRNELSKLGAAVTIDGDDLTIQPPARITPASIDTYDDHRMAMSFALAGLRAEGVVINDPTCVNKTFPGYFEFLKRLGEPETN